MVMDRLEVDDVRGLLVPLSKVLGKSYGLERYPRPVQSLSPQLGPLPSSYSP